MDLAICKWRYAYQIRLANEAANISESALTQMTTEAHVISFARPLSGCQDVPVTNSSINLVGTLEEKSGMTIIIEIYQSMVDTPTLIAWL